MNQIASKKEVCRISIEVDQWRQRMMEMTVIGPDRIGWDRISA